MISCGISKALLWMLTKRCSLDVVISGCLGQGIHDHHTMTSSITQRGRYGCSILQCDRYLEVIHIKIIYEMLDGKGRSDPVRESRPLEILTLYRLITLITHASRWKIFLLPRRMRTSCVHKLNTKGNGQEVKGTDIVRCPMHDVCFDGFVHSFDDPLCYGLQGIRANPIHDQRHGVPSR